MQNKHVDFVIDVPISYFGKISEDQIIIGGKFIVGENNFSQWNTIISEFYDILIRSGLAE